MADPTDRASAPREGRAREGGGFIETRRHTRILRARAPGARPRRYVVLGVSGAADTAALRKAYLKLALKYHPDKTKDASTEGAFSAVARAWALLERSRS